MALDLSKHRLIGETDTHWNVEGPGGTFRIAKKGLGKALAGKMAQHFAEGGEAVPALTGDPSADALIAPSSPQPAPGPAPVQLPVSSVVPTWDMAADQLRRREAAGVLRDSAAEALAAARQAPTTAEGSELAGESVDKAARAGALEAAPGPLPAPGSTPSPGAYGAQAMIPAHVVQGAGPSGPPDALAGPPVVAPGTAIAQAGKPTVGGGGGGSGIQSEIAKSYANAEAEAQAQADVVKRESAASLLVQQQNEAKRQELTDSWQKAWQGWQARGDELQKSILEQKIDPNRIWAQKGTGGKISAAIGMILGGIGAGLSRGPNLALQVIDTAIQRDLDAQKADLGKKESILNYHMQEGHSLQASYQLARADMLDASAAKLQQTATQFTGDKSQAAAQGQIAALQREAAVTRQQVAAQGLNMQFQGMQVEQARMGLTMGRLQMQALSALTNPQEQSGQPGQPARSAVGVRLDPRAINFLPDHLQERLVTMPDGSYALARTGKDASEVNKSFEGAATLREKLARYAGILQKHPHGVFSTTDPTDYATAQALHQSILTDINGLAGLNRFTETEAKIYAGRVPDLTDKQFRGTGFQAQLSELGKEMDDKIFSSSKQYLNLPMRKRVL